MGSLKAFRRGCPWSSWETAPNSGEDTAPEPPVRRSSRPSLFYCYHRPRVSSVLIGMDIMRPLRGRIDVINGTSMPTQPDPQTIHLNAAQQQDLPPTSRALLLQTTDIPAETARLVRCHNPWPSEDVYFCPEDALPRSWPESPRFPAASKCG